MSGFCYQCKYMYSNDTMDFLAICVNGRSENFGNYTGVLCEDECEDCEKYDESEGGAAE